MHRLTARLAITIVLGLSGTVAAETPCAGWLDRQLRCLRCMSAADCCPDDYCPKPLPCIACPDWCTLPDDYCSKPWPCIGCPTWCACCDDYCRKPLPNLCWPVDHQWYRCCPQPGRP